MDQTAALSSLNTILGDTGDTTFTSSEKTRALNKAWNDPYITSEVWDSSLSYTQGTYQYTLPATLSMIQDIYISVTGSTQPLPEPISNDLWELVNGKIQFNQRADYTIPSGYTLYLKGRKKLATTDSISDVMMQEYVLALAGEFTLKMLAHKKANLFTKNDVTMAELIGLKRELHNDVIELRHGLRMTWESA